MAKFHSANNLPATGGAAMFIVKTTLVSAGWVVTRSGDGLALFSSSGDIITTGASGAGGLGNTNAWFEIRDASTRVAFTFQLITTTTWRVKYTESGAFAAGTPGISQTGTATDQQVLYGAGTEAAPTGTQMLHTDNTYRFHVVANSTAQTGSGTFPFWFGGSISGTGVVASFFGLDGMFNGTYHSLDQAPRVIVTWYVATGPVTAGWHLTTTDTAFYARAWVLYGLGGATFKRFAMSGYFAATTGTGAAEFGGLTSTANSDLNQSPYAAEDQPLPLLIVRPSHNGTLPGPKGFCADFKVTTILARAYPTTILNSTNAYVYYGGLLVLWPENVAPTL